MLFNEVPIERWQSYLRYHYLVSVADAPPHSFVYSYRMDPTGPGAFMLTTEFNLDLATFGDLGAFWVQLSVDGEYVEQTPLTLLWKR